MFTKRPALADVCALRLFLVHITMPEMCTARECLEKIPRVNEYVLGENSGGGRFPAFRILRHHVDDVDRMDFVDGDLNDGRSPDWVSISSTVIWSTQVGPYLQNNDGPGVFLSPLRSTFVQPACAGDHVSLRHEDRWCIHFIKRLFVVNHHCRSAQVWHVFSRDFTVLPAHPHVHPQSE